MHAYKCSEIFIRNDEQVFFWAIHLGDRSLVGSTLYFFVLLELYH